MVVKAECEKSGVVSLDIGAANALRYFPRKTSFVELQLGDLCISCKLSPDFWQDQPRIHDPRLRCWLECKVFHHSPRRPVSLAMIPNGTDAFRIELLPLHSRRSDSPTLIAAESTNSSMDAPQLAAKRVRRGHSAFPPLDVTSIITSNSPGAYARAAS
jgi:hypothetical protein